MLDSNKQYLKADVKRIDLQAGDIDCTVATSCGPLTANNKQRSKEFIVQSNCTYGGSPAPAGSSQGGAAPCFGCKEEQAADEDCPVGGAGGDECITCLYFQIKGSVFSSKAPRWTNNGKLN